MKYNNTVSGGKRKADQLPQDLKNDIVVNSLGFTFHISQNGLECYT